MVMVMVMVIFKAERKSMPPLGRVVDPAVRGNYSPRVNIVAGILPIVPTS